MRGMGRVLGDGWRLAAPYFRSEQRWTARLLLGVIIALNLSQVGVDVLLNFWRGQMYDSLQNKDLPGFLHLVFLWRNDDSGFMPGFVPIVAIAIPVAVYTYYLTQLLQIRWRSWMNERLLGAWLSDRAYYTISLQAVAGGADNPDQRIAEDLQKFTTDTPTLFIDLLSTVVSLASFAQILWSLSGTLMVFGLEVPGYMLFIAILYAVGGTLLTQWIGAPLARIEFERQKVEADYRFGLIRVRENAEGIALHDGARPEMAALLRRFAAVMANWRQLMTRRKRLNALRQGYAQAAAIFPIVIASPKYFSGAITLGGLMRVAGAFSQVQSSLSWFVDNYPALATWRATVDRLTGFERAIATARALAEHGVRVREGSGAGLSLEGVTLALPDGTKLLDGVDAEFAAGRSMVVTGRSGSGKSTLFRALAGIWPFGGGVVARPPGTQMFLPQRPYLPLGTLREVLTYPAPAGTIGDAAVQEVLGAVGLGRLEPLLDVEEAWGQRLSGGEQQRLAIGRAVLLRPDWLFLDEATASLDGEAERELYALLKARLPGTTMISIAHREAVAGFHEGGVVVGGGRLG